MNAEAEPERQRLLQALLAGLQAVNGYQCTQRWLRQQTFRRRVHVLACGKAADSMALAAQNHFDSLGPSFGEDLGNNAEVTYGACLAISKHGHFSGRLPAHWQQITAAHPVPDNSSLRAGDAALALVKAIPAEDELLVLLSGGTSALLESLVVGVELPQLQAVNEYLLAHEFDIAAINQVRQRLSRIKAGGLLAATSTTHIRVAAISDVQGDDPATIGSGPFWPLLGAHLSADSRLPAWLLSEVPPKPVADKAPDPPVHQVIANNQFGLKRIVQWAHEQGLPAHWHTEVLAGNAEQAARSCVQQAGQTAGLHLWGGETTVKLPQQPGRGGRNQHLALAAAQHLRAGQWLLAVGTDGTDGPGNDAGALVDASTKMCSEAPYASIAQCLQAADSGHWLAASGDLLSTGNTDTNVMDWVMLWQ